MEGYFYNQNLRYDFPSAAKKTPDAQGRWYKDETCDNCERPEKRPRGSRPISGGKPKKAPARRGYTLSGLN